MNLKLFPSSVITLCDTAISILEQENEILEAMREVVSKVAKENAIHPNRCDHGDFIMKNTIVVFESVLKANHADIKDYNHLKSLVEHETFDQAEVNVFLRVIKRKLADCEKSIQTISVNYELFKKDDYKLRTEPCIP